MTHPKLPNLALAVVLAAGSPTAAAVELGWLATVGLTSDYVHRGITQSSGEQAVQAGLSLRIPQGVYAGTWASTLKTDRMEPDIGDGDGYEIDLLLGIDRPLNADWSYNLSAGRYIHADNRSVLDYDYTELQASLGWRQRLRVGVAYSPDSTDHRRDNTPLSGARHLAEVALEWPLTRWLSATGGVGYHHAQAVSEISYRYYGAGLNLRWQGFALGVTHYGTDAGARDRWPDGRADGRVVVNLAAAFAFTTTGWR